MNIKKNEAGRSYLFNSIVNIVGVLGFAAINLISTPLLLSAMGEDVYALYRTALVTIVSFAVLLDMGISSAVKRAIGDTINKNDGPGATRALGLSVLVYSGLGFIAVVLILIALPWLPGFLNVPDSLVVDFRILLGAVSIYLYASFYQSISNGIFVVFGRFDVLQGISLFFKFLHVAAILFLLHIGIERPLVAAAIVTILVAALNIVVVTCAVKKIWSTSEIRFDKYSRNELREFFSLSGYGLLISMGPVIIYYGQEIIVLREMGPKSLAIYAVAAILSTQIRTVLNAISSPLFTKASQYHARGDHEGIAALFKNAVERSIWLWVSIAVPLMVCGPSLLEIWMSNRYQEAAPLFRVLLAGTFGVSLYLAAYHILNSMGRLRLVAIYSTAMVVLSLGMSLMSIQHTSFGLLGIAFAVSIPLLLRGFLVFISANKITNSFAAKDAGWLMLRVGFYVIGCYYLINLMFSQFLANINGLFEVITFLGLGFLLTFGLGSLLVAPKGDVFRVKETLQRKLRFNQ